MSDQDRTLSESTGYEAPCVERILTPVELEHEILYAGQAQSTGN